MKLKHKNKEKNPSDGYFVGGAVSVIIRIFKRSATKQRFEGTPICNFFSSLSASNPNMCLCFSSADVHRSHEEQGPSVHHGQRGGERPSADARLPQGRPRRATHPPELRPGPGLLRASLKTKNLSSALKRRRRDDPQEEPGLTADGGSPPVPLEGLPSEERLFSFYRRVLS